MIGVWVRMVQVMKVGNKNPVANGLAVRLCEVVTQFAVVLAVQQQEETKTTTVVAVAAELLLPTSVRPDYGDPYYCCL